MGGYHDSMTEVIFSLQGDFPEELQKELLALAQRPLLQRVSATEQLGCYGATLWAEDLAVRLEYDPRDRHHEGLLLLIAPCCGAAYYLPGWTPSCLKCRGGYFSWRAPFEAVVPLYKDALEQQFKRHVGAWVEEESALGLLGSPLLLEDFMELLAEVHRLFKRHSGVGLRG